jgi:glutaminyl-peptide cyclotransferase
MGDKEKMMARYQSAQGWVGGVLAVVGLGLMVLAGCDSPASCQVREVNHETAEVLRQVPLLIRKLPHDPGAFTQGLLVHEGKFYESTGRRGSSSLREVNRETGEVLRFVPLAEQYFGEGLTLAGDRLIQLTWLSGVAFVYDLKTLARQRTFEFTGQGWGLCHDGESLFMTDGSATLYRRDPNTFAVLGTQLVTLNGQPLGRLNELECVGGHVYANVFMTNRIAKIDKKGGKVVADIDASALASISGRPHHPDAVLNGIAYEPESDTFYLTGKLWPAIFQVRFVNQ